MPTEAELAMLEDIQSKADILLKELNKLPPVHESLKSFERLTEALMWAQKAVLSPSEI